MNNNKRTAMWRHRVAIDADDHTLAIAGSDLYDRPLIDMNDSRCDYHCRTVFNLPLALVRRRRTLFGRLLNRIGGWL